MLHSVLRLYAKRFGGAGGTTMFVFESLLSGAARLNFQSAFVQLSIEIQIFKYSNSHRNLKLLIDRFIIRKTAHGSWTNELQTLPSHVKN